MYMHPSFMKVHVYIQVELSPLSNFGQKTMHFMYDTCVTINKNLQRVLPNPVSHLYLPNHYIYGTNV